MAQTVTNTWCKEWNGSNSNSVQGKMTQTVTLSLQNTMAQTVTVYLAR